jgi:hypothetical protein
MSHYNWLKYLVFNSLHIKLREITESVYPDELYVLTRIYA